MSDSLRSKTLSGVFWAFVERIGTQAVQFAVTIVLARLLAPDDYGVIAITAVFIAFSHLFVDCGLGSALIRKNDRTNNDFSTVFWTNLALALVCYSVLFVLAPFVADYYSMPSLSAILRVLGLNLIINSLYAIHVTRLTANVEFSLQAKVATSSCIVSGALGIALACLGYGAWALVGQSVSAAVFSGVMYWLFAKWRPAFMFSRASFRELFGFGSKIMASNFLHTVYTNISPLIIGRKYSASDLGFYSRADGIAAMPGGVFQSTLGRVVYPVLSSIQDDEARLRSAYTKYLRLTVSLVAPTMLFLAAFAEPLITVLIGDKWLPCVPYLQLLALAWLVDPIIVVNLNILYVKGRSDLVLKLEVIKKIIAITIVVAAVQYGVLWLCAGRLLYAYIALVLNLYYCGPFIAMGFWRQMREVAPIYLSSASAAALSFAVIHFFGSSFNVFSSGALNSLLLLCAAACPGILVYCVLAYLLKFDIVREVRLLLAKATAR